MFPFLLLSKTHLFCKLTFAAFHVNAHFATTIPSYKARCRLAADYSYVIFYVVKVEKIAIVDSSNMKNPFLFLSKLPTYVFVLGLVFVRDL